MHNNSSQPDVACGQDADMTKVRSAESGIDEEKSEGQKRMEAHMVVTMKEFYEDQKDLVNGMMQCEYVSCNYEDMSVVMRFPVLPWQGNRV